METSAGVELGLRGVSEVAAPAARSVEMILDS